MAGLFSGEPSHHGATESTHKAQENSGEGGGRWYLSRKEIEENSPSRRDGIDLKKEAYLRKSYCTFLQDLGMRLKVPQVTIATSIIFCHRFFLRQSHGKNDRRTIATVCMFLAGKVEETPRPLKDVILVSYEIIHKKDPAAVQRIKQKEVYEQQKELVLLGERVVLATLGFDLNVLHPYKPLVEAIKKFRVAQNALAQVAWNFVNDGLRTSLCLQFKPHHIAAGAIFLAAKFLKIKLPSDGEKVWWQEFDVTPRQLEEVSNQMLELYEQNRVPQAHNSEAEGSVVIGGQRPPSKGPDNEDHIASHSSSHGATTSKPSSSKPDPDQTRTTEDHIGSSRINQPRIDDNGNPDFNNSPTDYDNKGDEINDRHHREREAMHRHRNSGEKFKGHSEDEHEVEADETRENSEVKDKHQMRILSNKDSALGQSPQDAKKKLDTEKIKAAFVRRKALGDISRKTDPVDDIERELEDVEVPGVSEKGKPEKKQNWSKSSNRTEQENSHHVKSQYSHGDDFDAVEEGELEPFNDAERVNPKSSTHKRKLEDGDGKQRASDSVQKAPKLSHNSAYPGELPEDRNGLARHGYSERDYKRQQQLQENHV